MKVLLSNVSRKNGYMIIDVFFSVLSGMNYPVLAHDDTMLKFIDVDEKFKKTEIQSMMVSFGLWIICMNFFTALTVPVYRSHHMSEAS